VRATAGGARRVALAVAAALAVLVQLVVLYVPRAPGVPLFPGADKVIHLLVFAVPVLLLLMAGVSPRPVVAVFAVHAGASELVQGTLLPDRSADPLDALADLAGVALGWAVWRLARHGAPRRRW
jgi:hypothetical protein